MNPNKNKILVARYKDTYLPIRLYLNHLILQSKIVVGSRCLAVSMETFLFVFALEIANLVLVHIQLSPTLVLEVFAVKLLASQPLLP